MKMCRITKVIITAILLLALSSLFCDVWDPDAGIGNWQSSHYKLYIEGNETITHQSPFYSYGTTHLNDISQGEDADFKPEDGWCLYGVEFGQPAVAMSGFPVFGLYNEYLGLLRLFMLKPGDVGEYSYIALKAWYDGNSTLFGLGEESTSTGVKALDKRNDLGDCSFMRIFGGQTVSPSWYYIDLNLLYDPIQRIGDPSIYLSMYGAHECSVNYDVDLSGQVVSPNGSSDQSLLSMGQKLHSTYKNGLKQKDQVNDFLDAMADPTNETWGNIDLSSEAQGALRSVATFLGESGVASFIPWVSTASTLFNMMSGRDKSKTSTTSIELNGAITGSMTTQFNLVTTDFFESISGVRSLTPVYDKTMGLCQMQSTLNINHAKIMYGGGITGAHTYQLATTPPAFVLNPDAGLTVRNSELECAIEFTIHAPWGYTDYMVDVTGYTFAQMQDIGCYPEIRTDSFLQGLGGYYYSTFRTPFMPLSEIQNAAFTVPRAVVDARIVVKAIMDVNGAANEEPVYQLISFATDINDVPNRNSIYPHIPSQLIEVLFSDKTITNQTINLHRSYSIEAGKKLRFVDCTVNLDNSAFGILVNNGSLEFSNCTVNCPQGFIRANGDNSIIDISNGTTIQFNTGTNESLLSNGAQLFIDESSMIMQAGTTISISDNSSIMSTNSTVHLNGANLHLSGASCVSITDGSKIKTIGNSSINGETLHYYYDPASSGNGSMYGAEIEIPGDRVIIDNSKIEMDIGSSIGGSSMWDGITIVNCDNNPDPSYIMADINNVYYIKLINSAVEISNCEITNCGQLQVWADSDLTLNETNYHHNDYGIYVNESAIYVLGSDIKHNGSTGLSISYPSTNFGFMTNSEIAYNMGSGVELRHAGFRLNAQSQSSSIHDNDRFGYLNLSSLQNQIFGNVSISNNGSAEAISLYHGFPYFVNTLNMPLASVSDQNYDSNTFDKYLLVALGCPQGGRVYVGNLAIDTTDPTRFLPDFNNFVFGNPTTGEAEIIYAAALDNIYVQDFESAYDMMKSIVSEYSDTDTAKKALPYLPHLIKAIGDDPDELFSYLHLIDEEALEYHKLEALGLLSMSNKEYEDAIFYLEQIINDPPSDEEQLIAELDQAYCYYMLVESGAKKLPEKCHRKATTALEYAQIHDEIISLMTNFEGNEGNEYTVKTVELNSNYPNPFNPTTTISFSLPSEMACNLDIYNIRGQRVKTLLNDNMSSGKHHIVWDGKDNSGNIVSSGIYFYRLSTPATTLTSKMLLMK